MANFKSVGRLLETTAERETDKRQNRSRLRPVSTQENKHRIELNFFPSCIIRIAGPKKSKTIRVADHRFKLEQKIGTERICAASILFRSSLISCLWKSALRNTNENIQDNQVILTVSCKVRLGLQEGVHLRQELDRGFTVLVGI